MSDRKVLLRDVQRRLMEALRAYDAVCRQHGLIYWLDGGTLLGAIRHGGFIPWDDDLDVCVPRNQFNLLLEAAQDVPDSVAFRSGRDAGFAVNAKVIVPGLNGVPYGMPDEAHNARLPVGLDIVAMDPAVQGVRIRRSVSRLGRALASRYTARQRSQTADTALSRAAWTLLDRTPPGQVQYMQDWLVKAHSFVDQELLQYGIDTAMPSTVYSRKVNFPTRPLTFEGLHFPGPADPHEYLRNSYGDNYMTPPAVQRSSHESSLWYTD